MDEIGCFVGVSLKLNFGYDSAVLTAEDTAELDTVLGAIKSRPADIVSSLVFEVAGHTDSRGSDAYNQGLSERRANAARDYLVAGGIKQGKEYDHLNIKGSAKLGGIVKVHLMKDFKPRAGDQFDLLDGKTEGRFSRVILPPLGEGLAWDSSQFATKGILIVTKS